MLKLNNQVRGDSNRMGPVATVDNEESRFETGGSLSESSKDLLQFFLFCFLFFGSICIQICFVKYMFKIDTYIHISQYYTNQVLKK